MIVVPPQTHATTNMTIVKGARGKKIISHCNHVVITLLLIIIILHYHNITSKAYRL